MLNGRSQHRVSPYRLTEGWNSRIDIITESNRDDPVVVAGAPAVKVPMKGPAVLQRRSGTIPKGRSLVIPLLDAPPPYTWEGSEVLPSVVCCPPELTGMLAHIVVNGVPIDDAGLFLADGS